MTVSLESLQSSDRNTTASVFLFALAVLSVMGALVLGFLSLDFWRGPAEGAGIWLYLAVLLGFATVVCVTAPSWLLFGRTHNLRYRQSLRWSLVAVLLLLVEYGMVLAFQH